MNFNLIICGFFNLTCNVCALYFLSSFGFYHIHNPFLASCIPLAVRGLDLAATDNTGGPSTKEDLKVMIAVMEEELEQVNMADAATHFFATVKPLKSQA